MLFRICVYSECDLVRNGGEYRVGGLLGNENAIGLFFSTGILCSLVFFIKSKKSLVKILMILSMLALGFMMLLTGSRKSLAYALFGTYSHNNFVELLMNYGIVGFTLYYAFHAVLLIKLFQRATKNDIYSMFFFIYVCIQVVLGVGWVTYYKRPQGYIS